MKPLFRKALLKADEVRMQLQLDMFEPINIFDMCTKLGLPVRFVQLNSMEGMYFIKEDGTQPTIFLSTERPLPRRCYSCGHELGHHVFKHGCRVDGLLETEGSAPSNDFDEFLVDCFAGALLMPIAGIQAEFESRNWVPQKASPLEFYTISTIFGTGYETLIVHCRTNNLIDESKALALRKVKPAQMLRHLFSNEVELSYFKIFDGKSVLSAIDLEVSNYIVLPSSFIVEGDHLQKLQETSAGIGYMAKKAGIVRITTKDGNNNTFLRIQNYRYVGLAEYRHLED